MVFRTTIISPFSGSTTPASVSCMVSRRHARDLIPVEESIMSIIACLQEVIVFLNWSI
jgi:hypothetical protein